MRSVSRLVPSGLMAPSGALLLMALSAATALGSGGGEPCPPGLRAPVHVSIHPEHPCVDDEISAVFKACAPCVELLSAAIASDGRVYVEAAFTSPCPTVCIPDSIVVPIGRRIAGTQALEYRLVTHARFDSLTCSRTDDLRLQFAVSPACPAPPPGTLPYLKNVVIGSNLSGSPLPIVCPGDSIPVRLIGEFPDDCVWLADVQQIILPTLGFAPAPPIVRIVYQKNECLARPCTSGPIPWQRDIKLPALPGGQYRLPVEAVVASDFCIEPPDTMFLGHIQRPFVVAELCTTNTAPCFSASWRIAAPTFDRCDAIVAPDENASVILQIKSSTPLAGLQGEIRLTPPGLRIVALEPTGPAADMRIDWQPTVEGASFVMFSKSGAPIPGSTVPGAPAVPVLRVTAGAATTFEPAPRTLVTAVGLIASDANGAGVPQCPRIGSAREIKPDDYAIICSGPLCDFNGDGVSDVRDLVRMVRCVRGSDPCPIDAAARFDCNGDTLFDLDDVLCCARAILTGGRPGPGGQHDESISVMMGAPVETPAGLDVGVRLNSRTALGGARLALAYPADRFEVTGVSSDGGPAWLDLHDARDGELVVGLIALAGTNGAPLPLQLTVHLALKPGQSPGGSLTLSAAEFADALGAALSNEFGSPSVPLGGAGPFALSPAEPNPFSSTVRFTVDLERAADLDLAMFDLSGRRVATLHRGHADAGTHAFTWDGRNEGGERVRGGVYFYRARTGGQLKSQKVVFIGGR